MAHPDSSIIIVTRFFHSSSPYRRLIGHILAPVTLSLWANFAQANVDPAVKDDVLAATVYVLKGNFVAARQLAESLQDQYPDDGYGYTLILNALITKLSWDETADHIDADLLANADKALSICRARIKRDRTDTMAWSDCGVAYFALSYLNGVRGKYIAAGSNGQKAMDHFEQALALNPDFVDAKMYLGVAYYYAENLPPFIQAISGLLWFIPSADDTKSLPYLEDVMANGNIYPDVATFIYADLLTHHEDAGYRKEAVTLLDQLVTRYPTNLRLHLAHMTHSLLNDDTDAGLAAMQRFESADADWTNDDRALMQIWHARAHLATGNGDAAVAAFLAFERLRGKLPFWSDTWVALTSAQINDLRGERDAALRQYQQAIKLNKRYPNPTIRRIAEAGLQKPFTLSPPTNTVSRL